MALNRRWAGTISSAVLFAVVFASQFGGLSVMKTGHQGSAFGLLLFLLPGIIGCLLSSVNKVVSPIFGALIAAPLCLLLFYLEHGLSISIGYQLAYVLSAVFWCGCGALGCYFAGVILKSAVRKQG